MNRRIRERDCIKRLILKMLMFLLGNSASAFKRRHLANRNFELQKALAVTLCDKLMKAVETSTAKSTVSTTPNHPIVKPS